MTGGPFRDTQPGLLWWAVIPMAAAAAATCGIAFWRLTVAPSPPGPIDLIFRQEEVSWWFAGGPVYPQMPTATYPPQSYAVLWMLVGWNTLPVARWLWALVSALSLASMAVILFRASGAKTAQARSYVVLMWLSMNAIGVGIGLGQLTVIALAALTAGLVLVQAPRGNWAADGLLAALFQVALAKPTLAAPFVWVVMLAARRVRPLVLAAAGYVVLTLLAASFQPTPLLALIAEWATLAEQRILPGSGYGNLQAALVALGLGAWTIPAALVLFAGLGAWTYRRRRSEVWVLVGVAALVARLWTYHRVYDDVLTVLPMLALFRIATGESIGGRRTRTATLLLALATLVMLAPARLELARHPFDWLFVGGHVSVWLAMLVFLVRDAPTPAAQSAKPSIEGVALA